MNNIVVFIPHNMESELIEKSAETLRMHQMANIHYTPIIVLTTTDKKPMMTIKDIALILIENKIHELDKINQQMEEFADFIKKQKQEQIKLSSCDKEIQKHQKIILHQGMKQFNTINQYRRRILFNRTQCK